MNQIDTYLEIDLDELEVYGGPGSGNHGHAGIPGHHGGSAKEGTKPTKKPEPKKSPEPEEEEEAPPFENQDLRFNDEYLNDQNPEIQDTLKEKMPKYLYHVSERKAVDSIMKEGLVGGKGRGIDNVGETGRRVYLTNEDGIAEVLDMGRDGLKDPVVFQIPTADLNLRLDPEFYGDNTSDDVVNWIKGGMIWTYSRKSVRPEKIKVMELRDIKNKHVKGYLEMYWPENLKTHSIIVLGGPGSGNHGHKGVKGQYGGSAPKGAPGPSKDDWPEGVHKPKFADPDIEKQFQDGRKEALRKYAEYAGMKPEELEAELNKYIEEQYKDTYIAHRMDMDNLLKMLNDGRFKAQYETGSSGGRYNPPYRKLFEEAGFNWAGDEKLAPIYGTLNTANTFLGDVPGTHYGDVVVKFKDSLKSRSTVTGNDSFDNLFGMNNISFKPTPANKISLDAFMLYCPMSWYGTKEEVIPTIKKWQIEGGFYKEAQMWGGVKTEDIEEVNLWGDYNSNKSVADELKKRGIKVSYRNNKLNLGI